MKTRRTRRNGSTPSPSASPADPHESFDDHMELSESSTSSHEESSSTHAHSYPIHMLSDVHPCEGEGFHLLQSYKLQFNDEVRKRGGAKPFRSQFSLSCNDAIRSCSLVGKVYCHKAFSNTYKTNQKGRYGVSILSPDVTLIIGGQVKQQGKGMVLMGMKLLQSHIPALHAHQQGEILNDAIESSAEHDMKNPTFSLSVGATYFIGIYVSSSYYHAHPTSQYIGSATETEALSITIEDYNHGWPDLTKRRRKRVPYGVKKSEIVKTEEQDDETESELDISEEEDIPKIKIEEDPDAPRYSFRPRITVPLSTNTSPSTSPASEQSQLSNSTSSSPPSTLLTISTIPSPSTTPSNKRKSPHHYEQNSNKRHQPDSLVLPELEYIPKGPTSAPIQQTSSFQFHTHPGLLRPMTLPTTSHGIVQLRPSFSLAGPSYVQYLPPDGIPYIYRPPTAIPPNEIMEYTPSTITRQITDDIPTVLPRDIESVPHHTDLEIVHMERTLSNMSVQHVTKPTHVEDYFIKDEPQDPTIPLSSPPTLPLSSPILPPTHRFSIAPEKVLEHRDSILENMEPQLMLRHLSDIDIYRQSSDMMMDSTHKILMGQRQISDYLSASIYSRGISTTSIQPGDAPRDAWLRRDSSMNVVFQHDSIIDRETLLRDISSQSTHSSLDSTTFTINQEPQTLETLSIKQESINQDEILAVLAPFNERH